MKKNSIWSSNLNNSKNILNKDINCDVLIIGGGISGILTSFYLKDSNLKICLVDRNNLFSGVTSKTTGKITCLQDILTKISQKDKEKYLESQIDGINLIKNNINKYQINCHFVNNYSYLYTNSNKNIKKLKDIKRLFIKKKINVENYKLPINIDSKYTLRTNLSYEFNPIEYLNQIKNLCLNTRIYENTTIVKVMKDKDMYISITGNNNKIYSKVVIFATNYPYFVKPLFFPVKVHLEKSYIISGVSYKSFDERFNLINIDSDVNSIRLYEDKLIYLSNNKLLSSKVNDRKNFKKLINNNLIKKNEYIWSNIDLITNDYLPIVGNIYDNMYILTGYNTWGMTNSHIASYLIASMILKKKNKSLKYRWLFDPKRKISLKKIFNSSLNICDNINGYLMGMFTKNEMVLYTHDTAIYVDSDGKRYPVKRKCPHLKCNLLFNSIEKTWDCPCHGSRFDLSGNPISGPSCYSIKLDKDE